MDWLKAIIAFLLAIIVVGIGSTAIGTVSDVITSNSDIAGEQEDNLNAFFINLAQYVMTIFGICVVAPLVYILLGGFNRGGGREIEIGGQRYEF